MLITIGVLRIAMTLIKLVVYLKIFRAGGGLPNIQSRNAIAHSNKIIK
jgi:hypothetical protein